MVFRILAKRALCGLYVRYNDKLQSRGFSSKCEIGAKYPLGCSAVVTGGSTGIGLECVKYLLKNGVMNVMMSDKDCDRGECEAAKLRKKYPRSCLCFLKCDVTKCQDMKRLFKTALDLFGNLDIVVNNAGIFNERNWETMLEINVRGVMWGTFMAMECMSKERCGQGGAVVNMASILGLQQLAGAPVYVATKHALIGLVRSLGQPFHYCKSCVRVMALCPGVTRTPLITDAVKDQSLLGQEAARELNALPAQDVCNVGECLIHMLTNADTGAIWVSENQEHYEVSLPDRHTLRKK